MTDLLIHSPSASTSCDTYWCGLPENCCSSVLRKYKFKEKTLPGVSYNELKHSKSDDLILQSAPLFEPELHHGISDAAVQIQKDSCIVFGDDVAVSPASSLSPLYSSDPEIISCPRPSDKNNTVTFGSAKPVLKLTGNFANIEGPSRRTSRHINIDDKLDPEDSIKEIITENDFYRFVLFKRHYEKYLDISRKYEEAKNIAYYLEEKYHEVKAERDSLLKSQKKLEKLLETQELELHEREEELFLQLEKATKLEEDCEKLRQEKEKISEWTEQLQKEKNEMYRQLKLQADDSEITRRKLETARNDVVKQVTEIVHEKNSLEKENHHLKEVLGDLERKVPRESKYVIKKRSLLGLQQEVTELKLMAKQSATLNSQLKKGMKHLASCRRRKCSVCAYTRTTFGEYSKREKSGGKFLTGCFPFQDHKKYQPIGCETLTIEKQCAKLAARLSQCSFLSEHTELPPLLSHISYIDECSSSSESEAENEPFEVSTVSCSTAIPPHAFSIDSGISSEICDTSLSSAKTPSLIHRSTKWTSSFRKLIRRVSSKQQTENS